MEKVRQFGDSIASLGIYVIRRDDFTLLYYNKKMKIMEPDMQLGKSCCGTGERCKKCPVLTMHGASSENLTIDYNEKWHGFVERTADEYLWEDTIPAYIITVVPQIHAPDIQELIRYNRMTDTAATVLSESLSYGNFTKGTFTSYGSSGECSIHMGVTSNLSESHDRFLQMIHPDDRSEFEEIFSIGRLEEQTKTESEIYGEYRKKDEYGYHWISFRCIPIQDPFDQDRLCVFVVRNIDKRKQMERQLAIQLNATYQSIPGGVVIMRMDERMSILNASQSFYDMMGKTVEDYDGGYLEHILFDDRESVQYKLHRITGMGAPFDIVYREQDSKKQIHWVQARGTRINDGDGCPVYLVIRMDVTELKDAQQKLIEEQRLYREYTEGIIDTLSNLVEFRDMDSGEHIKRTKSLTRILLKKIAVKEPEWKLTEDTIEKIAEAAALHDVGKIAISDTILNKPGRLTADEFEKMKEHTVKGYEILQTLNLSFDEEQRQYCLDISRYHHERWDGGGYPDHLKGNEIPIWSQVVSIVDVYDALVSPRVYKKAYSHEKALEMILSGECGSFNPILLDCLKESVQLLEEEYAKMPEKMF